MHYTCAIVIANQITVLLLRSQNFTFLLIMSLLATISFSLGMLEEKYMISSGVILLTGMSPLTIGLMFFF